MRSSHDRSKSPHKLSASGLWKYYGERAVVQNISFELSSGEILGVLGPNGAGKTTTVGILYGGILPTRGEVRFGNTLLADDPCRIRAKLGVVTQENNLDRDLNVTENLLIHAHHYRLPLRNARAQVGALLEEFGLTDYRSQNTESLSGGLKRRLALARALLSNPEIVLLDEPTIGFDPDIRQEFWRIIAGLKERGIGILLTTHYMDEAERLCDRLLLLQSGRIVDNGSPRELVERIAGREIVEIEGISIAQATAIEREFHTWIRPFGNGYSVGVPEDRGAELWGVLEAVPATRLVRRRANLEDVFLLLTGAKL